MYILYSVLLSLGFLFALPYFLIKGLRQGKYFSNFFERLGNLPPEVRQGTPGALWIHAVSVGESNAITVLVEQIRGRIGSRKIVISTTTQTGQKNARERIRGADGFFYFPLDWRWSDRRSLNRVRPALVCLAETEIWPNFVNEAHRQGIRLAVINGRISERSYRRYNRFHRFFSPLLKNIDVFLMQTDQDAERVLQLGAVPDRVKILGNLKYDFALKIDQNHTADDVRERFLKNSRDPVWVAGSTAEGEEELVIDSFRELKFRIPNLRLILAPRKPERFSIVAEALTRSGLSFLRRSQLGADAPSSDVLLLDSMGELSDVYGLARVAFVGGSLVPRGGHNILEPSAYHVPVVFGPHMFNFSSMADEFLAKGAAIQVEDGKGLTRAMARLLENPQEAQSMGDQGRNLVTASSGATARTVEEILRLL
ncbi:MAG: 3-deoxy-D-manno-octulosonic acid transferase [Acidobacteriia bacterium]|nr:3-deoxy-D-manno-octulosonic acid transferase [Terriglobia bacterium]